MHTSLSVTRRKYTCNVCGTEKVIATKDIEKWVLICVHPDSRGTVLPVLQLREEGQVVRD